MNSSTSISRRSSLYLIAGLLALAGAVAYARSMLRRTGGIPSPPLDDTYIYLQYARRWAAGHFLSYCDGAPPSTGASSYLHMALLVPGWLGGLHDSAFVWWAVVMGTVYLAVSLGAGARLAARLAPAGPSRRTPATESFWRSVGWVPAAFLVIVILNGHFLWAAFTGMDTVLYSAGLVLVLAGLAVRGPAPGWPWLLAGGLSLFRPEGMPLGLIALAVMYGAALREKAPDPARAVRRLAWAAAAILLLFLPAFINWRMTGSPLWDSVRVKSIFTETRPDYLRETIRRLPEVWRDIAFLHVNDFHSGSWSGPAGRLREIIMGAGLAAGILTGISGRRGAAGALAVLWLAAGILLGGLSPVWSSHYFRYQIPYVPLAAALTVCGWDALARPLPRRAGSITRWAVVAAAALLIWPGARASLNLYGRNCSNILDQQTKVGRWINANTPPATRVALNDAGAITYYGNRRVVDLIGLVTHGFAAASHVGTGAVFEKLEAMPVRERPDILAIYPAWYPFLVRTAFTGPSLFSADLRDNTICGDRLKQVYRINWAIAGKGDLPVMRQSLMRDFGIGVVDQVDVDNLDSEAAHGYAWGGTYRDRLREYPTATAAEIGMAVQPGAGAVVEEGGRWISESERMRVKVRPKQWLIMMMRTETEIPFQLDVSVNGRPAGKLSAAANPLQWTEPLVQIPDSLVTDSLLTVDVRWVRDVHGDGYNSYHYWFLQP